MWPIFDFQYVFRSFRSAADLLTVISDRIARTFNRSVATRAAAVYIFKVFDRVWHACLLHKLRSSGISVRYLALFRLFSVIDGFEWFWMESLHENIQLMLEFHKASSSILYLSYYTLMKFMMMLSVILLPMPMILLSTISVIKHLTCGNNWNWLLYLNLIYETLLTGAGSAFLISMQEKLNWFSLAVQITLLTWNWMDQFLRKNGFF